MDNYLVIFGLIMGAFVIGMIVADLWQEAQALKRQSELYDSWAQLDRPKDENLGDA